MDSKLKKILRGISLEIRRLLEGRYDEHGQWLGGNLEQRLNELGVWRDRNAKPLEELPHLSPEDKAARRLVDGYLKLREEAGVGREEAVSEFVRESAYTWANRLFALRCMEARGIIDEVILQKDSYGGRSLAHFRFAKKNPDACAGNDDGLFSVLFAEFAQRAQELPIVFDPKSPAVALRPSIAALKRTVALLSGRETARGQEAATDEVFAAPDAFGWAYQYWNADEKDRVFAMVRTKKGAKIQGADIIPATQLYTEPYMVKFLVQNSLGALWTGMYPDSKLCEQWEYYVKDADRAPVMRKPMREITFLDPAQGSGHFHLEAFDLFYAMYAEEAVHEGRTLTPREICAAILNQNLYGIDIDGRSVQIATAALWMKAKERAPELEAGDLMSFHEHLVSTNIRLPKGEDHLELFLHKHPEDEQLRPALELVFQGLEHADELGALLQIEGLVDAVLRRLKEEADKSKGVAVQPGLFEKALVQGTLPVSVEDYDKWKRDALNRLQAHFETESQAADPVQAFFGESAGKGLTFFNLLARRYDVVAANPPYMHNRNMGDCLRTYLKRHYPLGCLDVYAAFLDQTHRFLKPSGIAALVVQQSFMFLSSYRRLRNELRSHHLLNTLAHLGSGAFAEISGEKVSTVLLCSQKHEPKHEYGVFLRLVDAEDKCGLLKAVPTRLRFRLNQLRFSEIPGEPWAYWLPEAFFRLFKECPPMGGRLTFANRTKTGNNDRFMRFHWEVAEGIAGRASWPLYTKGGRYAKWSGNNHYCIRWDVGARRFFRESPDCRITDEEFWFKEGITYTDLCSTGFNGRALLPQCVYDVSGPAMFDSESWKLILGTLNTPIFDFLLRLLNPTMHVQSGDVQRLPMPPMSQKNVKALEHCVTNCIAAKQDLDRTDPTEFTHSPKAFLTAESLQKSNLLTIESEFKAAIRKCDAEREMFDLVCTACGLDKEGKHFLVNSGFTTPALLPDLDGGEGEKILQLAKGNLKVLFERGPSSNEDDDIIISDDKVDDESDDDSPDTKVVASNFLEELAVAAGLCPGRVNSILTSAIRDEKWRSVEKERQITEDFFSVAVMLHLGRRWPSQIEAGEPLPAWADQDGVIPLTSGGGETPLIERVRELLTESFPGGNVAALGREFEEIAGVPLEQWLAGPFFERHISQFKKRPIAWHLETEARSRIPEAKGKAKPKKGAKSVPVFACLLYYHKLNAGLLPKIRTHYVGVLKGGYETELRTLERMANLTAEQQGRKLQLDTWIEEMKAFDAKLEQVSDSGFGPASLRPALRQYVINDALLSLTACWLKKLTDVVATGPISKWQDTAAHTELHDDLPSWIGKAFARLDFFCAAVGPEPPEEKSFASDPTSKDLAPLVCASPAETVSKVLDLACNRWWQDFDENVLVPLKEQLKQDREEQERVKEELELEEVKRDYARQKKLADRKDELKKQIKALREDIDEKTDTGKRLRSEIESWTCPEAATWEDWLGAQPLFDVVVSLDGERNPPTTIGEFIAQESAYVPDINDGVRVNIAPVQKAGLLHADVLDLQDADKAIADRAEWRANERRWVREGKLPQPGWWAVAVE